MPITVSGSVREGNSFDLYFNQELKTSDGSVVVLSMVQSATLTITVLGYPTTIVNNREDLDVADKFNEAGEFLLELDPADAVIISTKGLCEETHVATLTVVLAGAEPKTFIDELHFKITNLDTV
ncbi:MAG: hypothetical protein WBP29_11235 [Candidatus Zixiibacteriota bacterium]